jgi:hypothetical protein
MASFSSLLTPNQREFEDSVLKSSLEDRCTKLREPHCDFNRYPIDSESFFEDETWHDVKLYQRKRREFISRGVFFFL